MIRQNPFQTGQNWESSTLDKQFVGPRWISGSHLLCHLSVQSEGPLNFLSAILVAFTKFTIEM